MRKFIISSKKYISSHFLEVVALLIYLSFFGHFSFGFFVCLFGFFCFLIAIIKIYSIDTIDTINELKKHFSILSAVQVTNSKYFDEWQCCDFLPQQGRPWGRGTVNSGKQAPSKRFSHYSAPADLPCKCMGQL